MKTKYFFVCFLFSKNEVLFFVKLIISIVVYEKSCYSLKELIPSKAKRACGKNNLFLFDISPKRNLEKKSFIFFSSNFQNEVINGLFDFK